MMYLRLGHCVMAVIAFLNFAEARITDEEKQEIIRAHNHFRGKVDPIATNMEQMVSYKIVPWGEI